MNALGIKGTAWKHWLYIGTSIQTIRSHIMCNKIRFKEMRGNPYIIRYQE